MGELKIREHAPESFLAAASAFLGAAETENNLLYGILNNILHYRPEHPLTATIEEGGRTVGALLQQPPHNAVVSRLSVPAIDAVAAFLEARPVRVPGVLGEAATARGLAERLAARTGRAFSTRMELGAYELTRVEPFREVAGRLRLATGADLELLAPWAEAFRVEARADGPDPKVATARAIDEGRMHVWERDGAPVTMATVAGPTPTGIRIGLVYTPPELRGQGLASACVGELSTKMLESGRSRVFLFTDLSNPTSNRIYQRLGYRHVCDFLNLVFE